LKCEELKCQCEEIYIPKIHDSIHYCIGKNAFNNFQLIDSANDDDLWFHVNDMPSCHVIARMSAFSNKKIERKNMKYIIRQGALLCKKNSKYKAEKDLEIVYCKIKYIRKSKIPGSVYINEGKGCIVKC
jgi:predicted ribosome quality control (RQC) complex YloA/Tae2 family protein